MSNTNKNVYGSRSLGYLRGDVNIDPGRSRKLVLKLKSVDMPLEELI